MNNSKFRNKDGVSALVGVILLVCIVVAIAATVYVYIEGLRTEQEELTVEGTVLSVVEAGTFDNTTVYNITLKECECNYPMMFRSEDAVVPPTNVELRFYYNIVNGYYDVYKIKSL